jgi:hypothetical protein
MSKAWLPGILRPQGQGPQGRVGALSVALVVFATLSDCLRSFEAWPIERGQSCVKRGLPHGKRFFPR